MSSASSRTVTDTFNLFGIGPGCDTRGSKRKLDETLTSETFGPLTNSSSSSTIKPPQSKKRFTSKFSCLYHFFREIKICIIILSNFFVQCFNENFTIFFFFADFSSSSSNASSGVVACKAAKNQVVKQDAVVLKKAQLCPKIASPITRVNEGAGPSLLNTSNESYVPGSQQGEKMNSSQKKRRRDALRRKMLAHMDNLSEVDKIKQYFPSGSGPDCSLVIGRQNPHRAWSGLKKADFSTSGLIWTDNGLYEDPVKGNFFLF